MSTMPARRSARVDYTSNGRDYLCSVTGWSRATLDQWLTSSSVRTHLQLWYRICICSTRRFNDSIDWINTAYYKDGGELEEDLLLMCMEEGANINETSPSDLGSKPGGPYADATVISSRWATQEVWARTAWRIVQSNAGKSEAFERAIQQHPASAYALAIDILCLAFHSIAYREENSVWEEIITGGMNLAAAPPSAEVQNDVETYADADAESDVDMDAEGRSEHSSDDEPESMIEDDDNPDDEDFMDVEEPVTPKSKPCKPVTPKAPEKDQFEIGNRWQRRRIMRLVIISLSH